MDLVYPHLFFGHLQQGRRLFKVEEVPWRLAPQTHAYIDPPAGNRRMTVAIPQQLESLNRNRRLVLFHNFHLSSRRQSHVFDKVIRGCRISDHAGLGR